MRKCRLRIETFSLCDFVHRLIVWSALTNPLGIIPPVGSMVLIFFEDHMQISMKSAYGAPAGWLARLMKSGIQASERSTFFDRTVHLFKLNGEFVELLQDPQQAMKAAVTSLTVTQKRIVDALIACEVVAKVPETPANVRKGSKRYI